jgi:hypothetical protein
MNVEWGMLNGGSAVAPTAFGMRDEHRPSSALRAPSPRKRGEGCASLAATRWVRGASEQRVTSSEAQDSWPAPFIILHSTFIIPSSRAGGGR